MREQLFEKSLKNLFVGNNIEGKGGFVNLTKIRTKYY